jgi:hypothetical protein
MDKQTYNYKVSSRRPAMMIVLLLSLCFVLVAVHVNSPWFIYAPAMICFATSLWAIIANRYSGCALEGEELCLFSSDWRQTIDSNDIGSIHVTEWMEGPPTIVVHPKHAPKFDTPSVCVGNSKQFLQACRSRNISIFIKN